MIFLWTAPAGWFDNQPKPARMPACRRKGPQPPGRPRIPLTLKRLPTKKLPPIGFRYPRRLDMGASAIDQIESPQRLTCWLCRSLPSTSPKTTDPSMFQPEQYQLLDFGQGLRWENFGGIVVSRETPAVDQSVNYLTNNKHARRVSLHFSRQSPEGEPGCWEGGLPPDFLRDWQVRHGNLIFQLKPTPSGQVGLFPEQAPNWDWLDRLDLDFSGLKALNLFAYTGGTTLALAARGASVVHLDAARNVVQWARQNAELSGLDKAPIRWICDDALKFVQREIKRGSQYQIIVADPPSYGKGPHKELWKFSQHFDQLLTGLQQICSADLKILLLSCHTTGYGLDDLYGQSAQHFDFSAGQLETFPLDLTDSTGRPLPCGICLRYLASDAAC
jgi:23S rRNA (cytosine1962-C5)-methyltransferase